MSEAAKIATDEERQAALDRAPGWSLASDGALHCERRFPSPALAVGHLVAVALLAERHAHHPEATWVYRTVTLRLITHDAGDRVTDRDLALLADIVALG
jgi:4a-hydroxytetrahydrobiopterin dehydratase